MENNDWNENVFAYCFGRLIEKAQDTIEDDDGSMFFWGKKLAYQEAIEAVQNAVLGFGLDLKDAGIEYNTDDLFRVLKTK